MAPKPKPANQDDIDALDAKIRSGLDTLKQFCMSTIDQKLGATQNDLLRRAKTYAEKAKEEAVADAVKQMDNIKPYVQKELDKSRTKILDEASKKVLPAVINPQIKNLETQLEAIRDSYSKLKKELSEFKTTCDPIQPKIDSLGGDLTELSADLFETKTRIAADLVKLFAEQETVGGPGGILDVIRSDAEAETSARINSTNDLDQKCIQMNEVIENHEESLQDYHQMCVPELQDVRLTVENMLPRLELAYKTPMRRLDWRIDIKLGEIEGVKNFYSPTFTMGGFQDLQLELQVKRGLESNRISVSAYLWAQEGTDLLFRLSVMQKSKRFHCKYARIMPCGGHILNVDPANFFCQGITLEFDILEAQSRMVETGICMDNAVDAGKWPGRTLAISDTQTLGTVTTMNTTTDFLPQAAETSPTSMQKNAEQDHPDELPPPQAIADQISKVDEGMEEVRIEELNESISVVKNNEDMEEEKQPLKSTFDYHRYINFCLLEQVQSSVDLMRSRIVRRVEWKIDGDLKIWKCYRVGSCISSAFFSAAGIEKLQFQFYPMGQSVELSSPGCAALFLVSPQGSHIRGVLSLGPVKRPFDHIFDHTGNYGRHNFIRLEQLEREKDAVCSLDVTEAIQELVKDAGKKGGTLKVKRNVTQESLSEVLQLPTIWKNTKKQKEAKFENLVNYQMLQTK